MKVYVLKWKFHQHTAITINKEIEDRQETFFTFEDLLATYRRLKNALYLGYYEVNTDFEFFEGKLEKKDITMLDNLL